MCSSAELGLFMIVRVRVVDVVAAPLRQDCLGLVGQSVVRDPDIIVRRATARGRGCMRYSLGLGAVSKQLYAHNTTLFDP